MLSNFFILYLIFKTGLSLELGLDILGRLAGQQVTELCLSPALPLCSGLQTCSFSVGAGVQTGVLMRVL